MSGYTVTSGYTVWYFRNDMSGNLSGVQTDIEQRIRNRVQSDAHMIHIVSKLGYDGLTSMILCAIAAGTFFQDGRGGALQRSRLLCRLRG